MPTPELPFSVNFSNGRSGAQRRNGLGGFLVGLAAGAVALANWRTILRRGIPWGMKLRTAMARTAEDLADLVKEVQAEYAAAAEASREEPGKG